MISECEVCEGTGVVKPLCSRCSGSGEGSHDGTTCWDCKGSGVTESECEECSGAGQVDDWGDDDEPLLVDLPELDLDEDFGDLDTEIDGDKNEID